ncbi:growth hormone-regulated TBC protein 1-A isoform X3 [Oncorhynchus keta]|uniref:growth hormone-regulated TBC protein 1-A isoform X3 n=1 Tax=Oncorhynchus keta TaxID=8018 RepID=UPI00227CF4DD|nr:growth hormone-regulated TBC protein 1-A isoform X3 [Oncorhynchus keta]
MEKKNNKANRLRSPQLRSLNPTINSPPSGSSAKERVHSVDPYGFERLEDFDYESYEELMSEYLAVLTRRSIRWSRLLQGRGRLEKSIKVKRYVRKGVPNEHRGLVWMSASGAQEHLEKNPGYYHSLLDTTKQQHDPKLVDSIRTDLNRTFPDNIQFRKTSNPCLQKTLYNVLLAYGHHNPAVGYCQWSSTPVLYCSGPQLQSSTAVVPTSSPLLQWFPTPVLYYSGSQLQSSTTVVPNSSPLLQWFPPPVLYYSGSHLQSSTTVVPTSSPLLQWFPPPVLYYSGSHLQSSTTVVPTSSPLLQWFPPPVLQDPQHIIIVAPDHQPD